LTDCPNEYAFIQTSQVEQALADFHQALEEDPADWDTKTRLSLIHYMIAVDLLNKCRYDEAEIEMSIALGFNDKVAAYFVVRGRALYYQHKFGDSYADFKAALTLDPSNDLARKALLQFEPHQATLKEATAGAEPQKAVALPPINPPLSRVNPTLARAAPALRAAKEANEDVQFLFEQPGSGMSLEKDAAFADMLKRGKAMAKAYEKKNKPVNAFGTIWDSTADCMRIEQEKKEAARASRRRANSKDSQQPQQFGAGAAGIAAGGAGGAAAGGRTRQREKIGNNSNNNNATAPQRKREPIRRTEKTEVNADILNFFAAADAEAGMSGRW
jgi:tetratricopeptide (TPR) repeat protein